MTCSSRLNSTSHTEQKTTESFEPAAMQVAGIMFSNSTLSGV